MKRFFALTLLCLLLLCGCSKKQFEDGVACKELGKGVEDTLADSMKYKSFDGRQRTLINTDGTHYDDFHHVYSADSTDINEFGIFHARGEHAEQLAEDCRRYIEDMQQNTRAFIASYAPEELPKLDGARVERFGNYVVYTILPTDKTEQIFSELEDRLSK